MKISLIHPSRGRAEQAHKTFTLWLASASINCDIEHILSLDHDDPEYKKYCLLFQDSIIICNNNSGIVEATNHAAHMATGDILIYLSDDFECPKNWDEEIISRLSISNKWLLRVNDGYQPFENLVLTIPIMSRELYEELGYFFNPLYKSQWCDCDLYFVTQKYIINAPDLVFKHNRLPNDDTYERNNLNFETGRDIFRKRSVEFGWLNPFNKSK